MFAFLNIKESTLDGFNIAYVVMPETFTDFATYVVPVLQERGLVSKDVKQQTHRHNLFGNDHLPVHHPGKQYDQKNQSVK